MRCWLEFSFPTLKSRGFHISVENNNDTNYLSDSLFKYTDF